MQCEVCGSPNPVSNRFCGACGAALKTPPPSAAPPSTTSDYREPARPELKQVTVLFVDLVRSTELVAQLDPESAMQWLEPILRTMCDTVQRLGGTIGRTLGDGIMALFGAPQTQEGHAVLACQAALAIREAVCTGKEGLSIRAGLHSGEIVSDAPIGGAVGISSAYGMTLHLGSRLVGQVEPGDICISEACYRLVASFCEVQFLGQRALRGLQQPVLLYSLVGMRSAVAAQRFRRFAWPAFVGRDRELALLTKSLRTAQAGAGQIIGIAGVPGAGKSRLCYEFAELCRAQSIPVFETRSQPYGVATPLHPVLELLRSACFRINAGDYSESVVAAVAGRLAEVGATEKGDLPLVCDFLRIPFQTEQRSWVSAKTRNARLQDIVRSLLIHGGAVASVVIIEDLHWLDEASAGFVDTIASAVAAIRMMLIVNFRQPFRREWMQAPNYRQIELVELAAPDTKALVEELMGPHPALGEIRRHVAERSGGNPFFLEELVQSLSENGVLAGPRGAFRRGAAPFLHALPATVQAVIGARIDGLGPRERHVLQVGSIIGKEFDLAILQTVVAEEPDVLQAGLKRLCDAELLQAGDVVDEPAYRFRHPLLQEVAYTTQLRSRRRELHAAVAQAIERIRIDRTDEYAALVAHHLEEAGERNLAAFHAARAARWIGQMSSAQAMTFWQKVRTLMADEPRSLANDTLRIEASAEIAWLGWREGATTEQARPFVQEALKWARETDDSTIPLLLLVDGRIGQVTGGNPDEFVQQLKQAISLAESSHDTGRLATLHAALSHAYGWAGLLRQALEASDAAFATIADVSDFDQRFLGYSVEHWAVGLRGRILLRLGQFEAARPCFDRLISIDTLIDPTVLIIAHVGYVDMAWCLGDPAMAMDHAARIGILAERHGGAYLRLYHLTTEAIAHGVSGDYESAANGAMRAIEFLRQTGAAIELEPELLAHLADYLMRKGDHLRAIAAANDALAMAPLRGARLPRCRATITLASLAVLTEGASGAGSATALLDEAEWLIDECGASIYRARLNEARALLAGFSGEGAAGPAR